jgi:hypothetical protein
LQFGERYVGLCRNAFTKGIIVRRSFGLGPPPDGRAVTSPVFRRRIKAL